MGMSWEDWIDVFVPGAGTIARIKEKDISGAATSFLFGGVMQFAKWGIDKAVDAYVDGQIEDAMDKAEALESALGATSKNLPFLKGATNQVATGKSQPYIMGRRMFTPYLLNNKWYSISGRWGQNQEVTQVFECGFNPQVIEQINAGDILLRDLSTSAPQNESGDLIDSAFAKKGKYEIRQDGQYFQDLTEINKKVASTDVNTQIPYLSECYVKADVYSESETYYTKNDTDPVTYTVATGVTEDNYTDYYVNSGDIIYPLDEYAKDVSFAVSFPQGIYSIDRGNGDKSTATATIEVEYSLDGGSTWAGSITMRKCTGVSSPSVVDDTVNKTFSKHYYSARGNDYNTLMGKVAKASYNAWKRVMQSEGYKVTLISDTQESISATAFKAKNTYTYTYEATNTFVTADYLTISGGTYETECRFDGSHSFTAADYKTLLKNDQSRIYLRLRNTGNKTDYTRNAAYLLYYQSHCFDENATDTHGNYTLADCPYVNARELAYSTVLAVRLTANETNKEKLDSINVVTNSVARTWDGTAWSTAKTITENPAAIMLAVLTSDSHALSKYTDAEIDLNAFGRLYDFCNLNKFTFDYVQTTTSTKKTLLTTLCASCRATIFTDLETGLVSVAYDSTVTGAVADLDTDSVISVEVQKKMSRPVEVMRAAYTEAETWEDKTKLIGRVSDPTLAADTVIQDISLTGIIYLDHAMKIARYMMNCLVLRLKTVEVKVGMYGRYYKPYQCITLLDPALGDTRQTLLILDNAQNGNDYTLTCVDYNADVFESGTVEYNSSVQKYGFAEGSLPDSVATTKVLVENAAASAGVDAVNELAELTTSGVSFYNTHKLKQVNVDNLINNLNLDSLQAKLDDILNQATSGIEITDEKLTISFDDLAKQTATLIEIDSEAITAVAARVSDTETNIAQLQITADGLTTTVASKANQTTLDIQAGAIQAMISGGGSEGALSLSLELPAMITAAQRADFVSVADEESVAAVYALVKDTTYYSIRSDVTSSDAKVLWNDLHNEGCLASQIILTADQILIDGGTAVDVTAQNIFLNGKVQANYIDVDTLTARIMEVANITVKSTLTIGDGTTNGVIKSYNYAAGTKGFFFDGNTGKATLKDADISGTLHSATISSAEITGNIKATTIVYSGLSVYRNNVQGFTTGSPAANLFLKLRAYFKNAKDLGIPVASAAYLIPLRGIITDTSGTASYIPLYAVDSLESGGVITEITLILADVTTNTTTQLVIDSNGFQNFSYGRSSTVALF